MIETIPNVTIPGYGAYGLYSFDYKPGVASEYGTVVAEFVNESGSYFQDPLTSNAFIDIVMGNSRLGKFIPIETEITSDNTSKILKVTFADISINLDRYFVALRGEIDYDELAKQKLPEKEKQRIFPSGVVSNRIIYVGSSDEDCSELAFSALDSKDPCDICGKIDNISVNKLDCENYYYYNKRNFSYTIEELISALSKAGMGLSFVSPLSKTKNKFTYSGTVRDVLNNVCNEIGYTFYLSPQSGIIRFVDLRAGININLKNIASSENKCKILSQSHLRSRKEQVDNFGIVSLSKEGEEKDYPCNGESCRKLILLPFTLNDIIEDGAYLADDQIIGAKPNLNERLEFFSCVTGRLGSDLRNAALWTSSSGYNFKTAKDLETDGVGKRLSALGDMTVKKVFFGGSGDAQNKLFYHVLLALYAAQEESNIETFARENKTYFFLAKTNSTKLERIIKFEEDLCSGFYGQHWIRRFKQHWTGLSYSPLSPDGQVSYYDYRQPVNLPFANILYEGLGSLESSKLIERKGEEEDIVSGENPNELKASDTFFLMSRPSSFLPLTYNDEDKKAISEFVDSYLFKPMDIPAELIPQLKTMTGLDDFDDQNYSLFVVKKEAKNSKISIKEPTIIDHEEEKENVIIPVNACGKSTSYGLKSAETKKFSISAEGFDVDIIMPPQSFCYNDGGEHPGYTILVQRTGSSSSFFIPKYELFSTFTLKQISNAGMKVAHTQYKLTPSDLNLLKILNKKKGLPCDVDDTKIKDFIDKILPLINFSTPISEEYSFKLEGLPADSYSVDDGLKSLSIILGSSGLTTNISFSNTFPFKQSPESFFKDIKYNLLSRIKQNTPTSKLRPYTGNDLQEVQYE